MPFGTVLAVEGGATATALFGKAGYGQLKKFAGSPRPRSRRSNPSCGSISPASLRRRAAGPVALSKAPDVLEPRRD
jgi:hypothetical protein